MTGCQNDRKDLLADKRKPMSDRLRRTSGGYESETRGTERQEAEKTGIPIISHLLHHSSLIPSSSFLRQESEIYCLSAVRAGQKRPAAEPEPRGGNQRARRRRREMIRDDGREDDRQQE